MFRIKILNGSEWITIQDSKNKAVEPVLTEKLNSCGSLVYKTFITDEYYDLYKIMNTKVLVEEDGSIQFIGRLLTYATDFNNTKELSFEGELALLNDVMYPPYDFTGTPAELLTNVINYYNSKCSSYNQIRIGRITVTDKNDYIARSCKDYSSCWEVINTKLIQLCGGYIKLRWVLSDGEILRYIDYLEDPGKNSEQKIEFSKNLLDVNKEMAGDQICTVLIPLGAEDEEAKKRVDITSVNDGRNYIESQSVSIYGRIESVVIFDDVTVPANLLTKAQKYLQDVDKNIHTIKINAIDLHALNVDISRYNVGDIVNVYSKPHDIETSMLITERERNLNDPSLDSISLGKEEKTYTSNGGSGAKEDSITSVDIEYGISDSQTKEPSSWNTVCPEWQKDKYIWQRTVCRYLSGTTIYSDATCIQGASGADGKDGINGTNGKDGVSSYFFIRYSAYSDGTSMTVEPASNTKYIGVATTTVNAAPTSKEGYTWTLIKGSDGTNGTPGVDGSSSYLHIKYSNDGKTFTSNSGEDLGTWIGTLVDTNVADSAVFSDYTWKKYVGADGKDGIDGTNGDDGRGIAAVIEEYYLSSSKTEVTGGTWQTTCPEWKKGYYIWTRSKVTWMNPTEDTYTEPILAGASNQANETANEALESIPTEDEIKGITKEQTSILLGMKGGYLEFLYEDSKNPDIPTGLRIMDSKNKGSASNVILLNSGGFGFSNSGVEGPYFNAWTIDGHLSADAIYTGILQDRAGNFKLNMDTGEISVKKLTLNTPDLIFGVYPSGNYIEITETESSDGILFNGTGKILMTPSGAFDVRNIVSNVLKNQLQISAEGTSNNISLWNNLHSNANYFANSITMSSQTQVDGSVNNSVNIYNYLVGSNTESNYISMSNNGSNKYLKINNDGSKNRLWFTRSGNNTHLQLANYSINAGSDIYTNVLEFDSSSGILMFNMDWGYPGSFNRAAVTGMKMYNVDFNINSKDDMRITASGLLYLNASADYVTKIWYNGAKLKKAVTISGDQVFISVGGMCFRVTGMYNNCLAVESITYGNQSESSGGKYRFQKVDYNTWA